MSTIIEKINIIDREKLNMKTVIEGKGATVTDSLASFASAIDSIQTGGKIEDKKTINVTQNGIFKVDSSEGFDGLKGVDVNTNIDTSGNNYIKIHSGTKFYNARFVTFPWTSWDISELTDMENMFGYCKALTSVPQFDTSKVTDMHNMFDYCEALTSVPLLDISNVTDMSRVFNNCKSLKEVRFKGGHKGINCDTMFGTTGSFGYIAPIENVYFYLPGDYSDIEARVPSGNIWYIGHTYNANIRVLKDGNWLTGSQNLTINNQTLEYKGKGVYFTTIPILTEEDTKTTDFRIMLDNAEIGLYKLSFTEEAQDIYTGTLPGTTYEGNTLANMYTTLPKGWLLKDDGSGKILHGDGSKGWSGIAIKLDKLADGPTIFTLRSSNLASIWNNNPSQKLVNTNNIPDFTDFKIDISGGRGATAWAGESGFRLNGEMWIKKVSQVSLPPYPND